MSRSPQQPAPRPFRPGLLQVPAHYQLSAAEFMRLRDVVMAYSGVYLDNTRQRMLEQALMRRMRATTSDFASYAQRITTDREELQRLVELVLNHETSFFRNQPHMRALREVLLPELHQRKPRGEPIRMWSAGCATGEEAYSLAITALEVVPFATRPVHVWATDLSETALATARKGQYSARAIATMPPELLARYFQPQGDAFLVVERVRRVVNFAQVNLLEPLPREASGVDIIFCQNVMIYFQQSTSQAILEQFYQALPDHGVVCLGFSETLWNVFDAFHPREVLGGYVYYKDTYGLKPASTTSRSPKPGARVISGTKQPPAQSVSLQRRETRLAVTAPVVEQVPDAERLRRARVLLQENEVEQALEMLRQIAPPSELASQAMLTIARVYADRGEFDLAIHQAQQVLVIDIMNYDVALLLGILYGRRAAWDKAVEQLERARYLDAAAPLVSFHLAEAYWQQGRPKDAVREYRNTTQKLQVYSSDTIVDGVAVGWLRDSCQQQIHQLSQHISEKKKG